jgi:broad specificity phosphatase PhoE
MKFIFFRHGETDGNVKNIMQGATMDTLLNANGIQQAKQLAEKAKDLGLEKIYSSKLTRAIQTATLTAATCGLDVEIIDDVEEFHYGEVEGMYVPDAIEKFGIDRVLFSTASPEVYDEHLPGGETINQCIARVMRALQKIKEENEGKRHCIGIFSHGAVMCILYYYFFKIQHPIANCEWFEAEI